MIFEMTGGAKLPPRRFQVLGERSSGTNFVTRLVRNNLKLRTSKQLGWKHAFPSMLAVPNDFLVIAVFRSPLNWLLSMHSKPWHASAELQLLEFSDFLRAPWDSRVDKMLGTGDEAELGRPLQYDRDPLTGEMFANLMQLRTAKARALLTLPARTDRVVLVALEYVQQNPERFIAALSERYGRARHEAFQYIEERLGSKFRSAVRKRPATPPSIAPADLDFVRQQLDSSLEARLGYAV